MKRIEKIILIFILSIALLVFAFNKINYKDSLIVYVKNTKEDIVLSFNIYEDNVYEIDGDYGIFRIEVKDGKCHAYDVDCPNKICEATGWISADNPIPIICLPNGLVVMIGE